MSNRRDFIRKTALGSLGVTSAWAMAGNQQEELSLERSNELVSKPRIVSTWNHGLAANDMAWKTYRKGKNAIDAIEAGVKVPEADPEVRSVGYGGLPDREGKVTLDACIMNHHGDCGAVSFLQGIKHPISVAKLVMNDTPHVMLTGEGAQQFARAKGFKEENLLTDKSRKDWQNWLKESDYKPVINIENHDTISMLMIDEEANLSGACTTSGAAWKMHGRVGDSPIIGAGLFLDNEVGAAAATGLGEAVIRTAGSAMVVELMRQGKTPYEACKEIVQRIYEKHKNHADLDYLQVGFIALNKQGEYAGFSLRSGFNYAIYDQDKGNRMEDATYIMEWQ